MAAYKATHEERPERRRKMLDMHKRGLSYGMIGRMFGISKNSARKIVLLALGKLGKDGKLIRA